MPDKRVTELTAIDAVTDTDLVMVIDDPAGTAVNKKATVTQLLVDAAKTNVSNTFTGDQTVDGDLFVTGEVNPAVMARQKPKIDLFTGTPVGDPAGSRTVMSQSLVSGLSIRHDEALAHGRISVGNYDEQLYQPLLFEVESFQVHTGVSPGDRVERLRVHPTGGVTVGTDHSADPGVGVVQVGSLGVTNVSPEINLIDSAQAPNAKQMRLVNTANAFNILATNDAGVVDVGRSTWAMHRMTGVSQNCDLLIAKASPALVFDYPQGTVDARKWRINQASGYLWFSPLADNNTQQGATLILRRDGYAQVGAGVIFPTAQVASAGANTLDDYEEGSWAPTLNGDSGNSTGQTYAVQTGRYVKVGLIVHAYFDLELTAFAVGAAANLIIMGWPFTHENGSYASGPMSFWANLTVAAGVLTVNMAPSQFFAYVRYSLEPASGNIGTLQWSNFTLPCRLMGSLTYRAVA